MTVFALSCKGVCNDIVGRRCRTCNKCKMCGDSFPCSTVKSVCLICYDKYNAKKACHKKKCKRYVQYNTLEIDKNEDMYCGNTRCKNTKKANVRYKMNYDNTV